MIWRVYKLQEEGRLGTEKQTQLSQDGGLKTLEARLEGFVPFINSPSEIPPLMEHVPHHHHSSA
jgi:hypothetical protein